jgi:hypothetical protein
MLTLRGEVSLLEVKIKKSSGGIAGTVLGRFEAAGEECYDD